VSKQKDTGRIVTPAAYLLFYRRRSEIPLGGPRFQEIFDRFNSQSTPEDDMMLDSGEGQRLGQGSSLRGSPSASTGAGLILPQGNLGLASVRSESIEQSTNIGADAEPPSYEATLGQGADAEDDIEMGAQLSWTHQGGPRNSIEGDGEDEGIDLPEYSNLEPSSMTSAISQSWTFKDIVGSNRAGSEATGGGDDLASDVAQNDNSSTHEDAFATDDVDPIILNEPGSGYIEPPEPQGEFPAYELPPEPTPETQHYMDQITAEAWERQVLEVPVIIGDDQASDKVAEIHVGDDAQEGSVA
jgi:ubiquitin carboxyl-terminal hydrolase 4/11